MGAAIPTPTSFVGELSLLPVHTPIATNGVYPIVQPSLAFCVVPVLAATSYPGICRGEFSPKRGALAALSDKILLICLAIWVSKTFLDCFSFCSIILPSASVIFKILTAGI